MSGGAGGDRGSYQSSKRSFGRKTVLRLRRALAAVDSAALSLPGLRRLWWLGVVVLVVNAALGIAAAAVLAQAVQNYADAEKYADLAAENVQLMLTGLQDTLALLLANRGWLPRTAQDIALIRGELDHDAHTFADNHRAIYDLVQGTPVADLFTAVDMTALRFSGAAIPEGAMTTAELGAFVQSRGFATVTLPGGTTMLGTRYTTSFLDFGMAYAANVMRLAEGPASNVTDLNPLVLNIITNAAAGSPFHAKTYSVLQLAFDSTTSSRSQLETVSLAVFLGMGVALLVVSAVLIVPVILSIDRSRDAVVQRFLTVPPVVLEVLKSAAEKRLKDLRRSGEGADAEVDDTDSDDDDALAAGAQTSGDAGSGLFAAGSDGEGVDWDAVFQHAGATAGGRRSGDGAAVAAASPVPTPSLPLPVPGRRAIGRGASSGAGSVGRGGGDRTPYTVNPTALTAPSPVAVMPATLSLAAVRKTARKPWWSRCALAGFMLPNLAILLLYAVVYGVTVRTTSDLTNLQVSARA